MRMLARTFLAVFPEGALIRSKENEAALLGTVGDGASAEEMARRAARRPSRSSGERASRNRAAETPAKAASRARDSDAAT